MLRRARTRYVTDTSSFFTPSFNLAYHFSSLLFLLYIFHHIPVAMILIFFSFFFFFSLFFFLFLLFLLSFFHFLFSFSFSTRYIDLLCISIIPMFTVAPAAAHLSVSDGQQTIPDTNQGIPLGTL